MLAPEDKSSKRRGNYLLSDTASHATGLESAATLSLSNVAEGTQATVERGVSVYHVAVLCKNETQPAA